MVQQHLFALLLRADHISQQSGQVGSKLIALQMDELLLVAVCPILATHLVTVHHHTHGLQVILRQSVDDYLGKALPLQASRPGRQFVALKPHLSRPAVLGASTGRGLCHTQDDPLVCIVRCRPSEPSVRLQFLRQVNNPFGVNHFLESIVRGVILTNVFAHHSRAAFPCFCHCLCRKDGTTQLQLAVFVGQIPIMQIQAEIAGRDGWEREGLHPMVHAIKRRQVAHLAIVHAIVRSLQLSHRRIFGIPIAIEGVTGSARPVHAQGGMLGRIVFAIGKRTGGERHLQVIDKTCRDIELHFFVNQRMPLPLYLLGDGESQCPDIPKLIGRRCRQQVIEPTSSLHHHFALAKALHTLRFGYPRATGHISVGEADFKCQS